MTQIPLSREYVQTPWPIAGFNLMTKPGGPACNLSCEYCYYRHKGDDLHLPALQAIDDALLEQFIGEYIQSQDAPTVFFTWQGGEPTLLGLPFYEKVVKLQEKHARSGQKIANSFQTNGVLLDEPWCQFLAQHRFLVGVSIDGPADIHDTYRKSAGGQPSFGRVLRAVRLLQQFGARLNTLTTITPANVERVDEVYRFLTGEIGSIVLQIQPCVERKDFRTVAPNTWDPAALPQVGSDQLRPGHANSIMTDWSISAEQWGEFLCRLFDLWWPDRQRVVVNWFDSWASQWVGRSALMCICSPICGRALSMERDGRIFSCDHYVHEHYCIGTLGERPLSEMIRSQRQRAFAEAKIGTLPGYCRRCPFLFACYGECPKRRFVRTPEGEPGLNYLCAGFRRFFDYAGPRLAEHGRQRYAGSREHNQHRSFTPPTVIPS